MYLGQGNIPSVPSSRMRLAVFGARPSSARDGRAGFRARLQFQYLAQQGQGNDHRRGFEIHRDLPANPE